MLIRKQSDLNISVQSRRKRVTRRLLLLMVLLSAMLLSSCEQDQATPTETPEPIAEVTDESSEPEAQSTEEEDPIQTEVLPPDPQPIEFQSADGAMLYGTYYPAAVENAPLVIMFHWARGDQTDWMPYAVWMQNRGPVPDGLDFEALPPEFSFAVFTFDYRGFGRSPGEGNPENWLMDAMAAVETARGLAGVDPTRSANIGASIGADGAADSCDDACLGAMSISPGNYLTVAYADRVMAILPRPVRCLASQGDQPSAGTCANAGPGDNYEGIVLDGSAHGMDLLEEDDPVFNLEGFFLEFLEEAFDILL
jgi:pimeloyl-ACP methyl ester carboxylesterase